jgi:hypothetical protein
MGNNLCFLSKKETKKINSWIKSKEYSVYSGYFVLRFGFKPTGIESIELDYISKSKTDRLFVFDNTVSRDSKDVDVKILRIEHIVVELDSDKVLNEYNNRMSKSDVSINEDCEPQIFYVEFKISSLGYGIYIEGNLKDEIFMPFRRLSADENKRLLRGVSLIKIEDDPNVPYFNSDDIVKIVDRAADIGLKIYGIECWSSVDYRYFRTYVVEGYADEFNAPQKKWAKHAVRRLISEYNDLVLKDEPNNPPIFNLTIGRG